MLLSTILFAIAAHGQFLQGLNHLRFGCSQLTIERLDPLVNPGMIAKNGTFKRVPQIPNRFLFNDKFTTQTDGGVTVYYIAPKKGVVTAFKPGFRNVFGWKGDALQRAMDDNGCFSATCGNQKSQDISAAKQCKIPKTVKEDVDGCK
ncbi:hypothetical protein SLS60_004114 [Paraconiothyrium brasiliense]|uniref:DUF1996 domain-containing protein n=1 Tax=Paraconiothyrium brasiliense TaxID=300254 RepID=A0ABR3RQJ8_9PLEO